MGNKYFRIGIGFVVAAISLYFMWQWLYADICLDMGGAIHNGICHDESYHDVYIVIDKPIPVIGMAITFSAGCVVLVNWLLKKAHKNAS